MSAPARRWQRAQELATERLRAAGVPHPGVAAALTVARGRRGRDAEALARDLGVSPDHLRSLESGHRPPEHAPRRLRDLEPAVDWQAAGVVAPDDPADPASRHPAGRWREVPGSRS